jgi:hypothetical protein
MSLESPPMNFRPSLRLPAALAGLTALPALAHVSSAAAPHWHAGDAWGVLVVIGLTAAAAWLDRRGR